MRTFTIGRSLYNRWIKMLYNQEHNTSRIYCLVEEFPPDRSWMRNPSPSLEKQTLFDNQIHFDRTGRGWKCSAKLIILDNIPCPLLPAYYRYEIEEGFKTIQQLEAMVIKPRPTAQDVIRAGLGELGRRRATN